MKVILFGATGMIGRGVLLECLDDTDVSSILLISRNRCGIVHEKIEEILHDDFFDYSSVEDRLSGYDACLFCLGVSAAGMTEERYSRLTHELTIKAAEALLAANPSLTFCYISGAGADDTETGRIMWARVKGKTENALLRMPFGAVYVFRPAYIQPLKGVKSRTRLYRLFYAALAPVFPVFKTLLPNVVTTTEKVGLAMIRVARQGHPVPILETRDINRVAAAA